MWAEDSRPQARLSRGGERGKTSSVIALRGSSGGLRAPLAWLVLICLLLGAGLGQAQRLGGVDPCGTACPCEEAEAAEHALGHHDADSDSVADDAHGEDDPCSEDCADDCPDCRCSVGTTVAVAPSKRASVPTSGVTVPTLTRVESPVSGVLTGVFRPPRSCV